MKSAKGARKLHPNLFVDFKLILPPLIPPLLGLGEGLRRMSARLTKQSFLIVLKEDREGFRLLRMLASGRKSRNDRIAVFLALRHF